MIKINSITEWFDRYVVSINGTECKCIDTETGINVTWRKCKYNDTQKFTLTDSILDNVINSSDENKDTALLIAELSTLLSDYLFAFHYDLLFDKCTPKAKLIAPLRACRIRLGLSVEMVELYTGIPYFNIEKAEQGKASYSIIFQLLEYYGLGVNVAPLR
jgi:hypothetical protein